MQNPIKVSLIAVGILLVGFPVGQQAATSVAAGESDLPNVVEENPQMADFYRACIDSMTRSEGVHASEVRAFCRCYVEEALPRLETVDVELMVAEHYRGAAGAAEVMDRLTKAERTAVYSRSKDFTAVALPHCMRAAFLGPNSVEVLD